MSCYITTIFGSLRNIVVTGNSGMSVRFLSRLAYSNCHQINLRPTKFPFPSRGLSHGPPLSKPMIEDRVMLVLQLYDKIDPQKSDLVKDFGLDSLDMVEVNVAMEEEFTFDIPSVDAIRLRTPSDIVQYICDKHDIYD